MLNSLRNWYYDHECEIIALAVFGFLGLIIAFTIGYYVIDFLDPYYFHERPV